MIGIDYQTELNSLPDKVADALLKWRTLTLEREKIEATLYLKFKGDVEKRTADEVKALVRQDFGRYESVLKEITAESEYNRLYERLLSLKRLAAMREAY